MHLANYIYDVYYSLISFVCRLNAVPPKTTSKSGRGSLLEASSEDITEDPCAGHFQMCDKYVTLFLVFDELFLLPLPAIELARLCRLLLGLGHRAPYYETTNARNIMAWSLIRLPTKKTMNTWRTSSSRDTTSFFVLSVAWCRHSYRRVAPLGCSWASVFG